ncbi:hypothetical protein VTO73DRAFT_10547 [Trametes versicolor]
MSADPPDPHGLSSDAPADPAPTRTKCQVIPADGEPPCTRIGRQPYVKKGETRRAEWGENRILCREHDTERQRLYHSYKACSAEVDGLKMQIAEDASLRRPDHLSMEEVDAAIAIREKYENCIDDELNGRESHRKRFVVEVDDGHATWLKGRRDMRAANSNALKRLRHRKNFLVAKEETRKREEEEDAARLREEEATRLREEAIRIREERDARARAEEAALRRRNQEALRKSEEEAERNRREIAAREQQQIAAYLERNRQREVEEANARRVHVTTHETQPLLGAGQPSEPSTLYPQVSSAARILPYGSRASPRGVDIERQNAAFLPEIEAEPCLGVFDVCFVLGLRSVNALGYRSRFTDAKATAWLHLINNGVKNKRIYKASIPLPATGDYVGESFDAARY